MKWHGNFCLYHCHRFWSIFSFTCTLWIALSAVRISCPLHPFISLKVFLGLHVLKIHHVPWPKDRNFSISTRSLLTWIWVSMNVFLCEHWDFGTGCLRIWLEDSLIPKKCLLARWAACWTSYHNTCILQSASPWSCCVHVDTDTITG